MNYSAPVDAMDPHQSAMNEASKKEVDRLTDSLSKQFVPQEKKGTLRSGKTVPVSSESCACLLL